MATVYDRLAEEVLTIGAEVRASYVVALRLDALLDQVSSATADAAAVLSVLETPAAEGGLMPAEIHRLRDSTHALLKNQRALLDQGWLLRDQARAKIARTARRLQAAQAKVDQLLTGDGAP
jgi:hypothetical protein